IKQYQTGDTGGQFYYDVEADFSNRRVKKVSGMELKRIPEDVQIPDSTYYIRSFEDPKTSPTICRYNDSIMLMSHTGIMYDKLSHKWKCQILAVVDDSINVENLIVWQKNPTMLEMSPMTHSMSISDDALYCGAILGMDKHFRKTTATIYSTTIMLTKFDKDLHQIWSRYYEGNDMFYDLNSVMATDDGGCIMTGVCSKKDSYHTFYTYILKVDADGYDAIAENAEQTVKPYHCYPNPTSDRIFIDISPDVECAQVDIYTLDGRLLQSQISDFETVDMSNLESGIYIIKVRLADGREYAERVVRE
ncbi:MAG: T9SS type A sorting domain-containing protein, partial [Bacteroidales bacterium]|nr:T9SS type A sorting domain-containing protein [Bacteroidales bacterium]